MLVLERKLDQRIVLTLPDGSLVTIAVVEIRSGPRGEFGKVRLGIEAPTEVGIDREEIHLRKRRDAGPGMPQFR